jgi:hypothetical protein
MPHDDQRERAFDWRPLPYVEGRGHSLRSEVSDPVIDAKMLEAARVLNEVGGERNLSLGCDASALRRMAWTPDNMGAASSIRAATYLRTGLLRTPFARVYAELLTTAAKLPVKVIAFQKAHAIPLEGGDARASFADCPSWLRIAKSDIAELGSREGLFSEDVQEELGSLIRDNWCGIMSERSDIHAALTVLNEALPLQFCAEDGKKKPWEFDYGYPQDGTHPNLRLDGLKDFAAAGTVMDALKAVGITTEMQTTGPDTDRQPIVMVQGWESIRGIIRSDLSAQTTTASAAIAEPPQRPGLLGGYFGWRRGPTSESRPG